MSLANVIDDVCRENMSSTLVSLAALTGIDDCRFDFGIGLTNHQVPSSATDSITTWALTFSTYQ
jgi:hypothetical protein